MKQIFIIQNTILCGRVINYMVEFYSTKEVCTKQGIPAAGNGWHERPCWATRRCSKPYKTEVMTPEQLEKYLPLWGEQAELIQ